MAPDVPSKRASKRTSTVVDISTDEESHKASNMKVLPPAKKKSKCITIDLTHLEDEEAGDTQPKGMFSKDVKSLIKPLPVSG